MRQIILSTSGAMCVDVPSPTVRKGCVLIRVDYSFVSVGTEIGPLKQSMIDADRGETKLQYLGRMGNLAGQYAYRAVRHPDKAVRRVKRIVQGYRIRRQDSQEQGENSSDEPTVRDDMYAQGWNVGYSISGTVVAVGEGVDDFSIGDRVAAGGAGLANHADFVCVPRNLVCGVPTDCSQLLASTATVGAIVMQAVRRSGIVIGERAAVIGLGLLGQILVRVLVSAGCKVIAFDPKKERILALADLKNVSTTDSKDSFIEMIKAESAGHGADVAFLTAATSSSDPANLSMKITRRRGKVVIVGNVGLNLERQDFYRREIDLLMSTSYGPGRYDRDYEAEGKDYPYAYVRWTLNRNMRSFLELIASKRIDLKDVAGKPVPVSRAPEIYEMLLTSSTPPLGVIFGYDDAEDAPVGAARVSGAKSRAPDTHAYALVGVGAFGVSMIVPRLLAHPGKFDLRAVVSSDAVRGGNFARQEGVEIIGTSIGQVLAEHALDAVVIASRHDQHAQQVVEALNAGLHVFVEKPLALSWRELDDVVDAYRKSGEGATLTVGFNRRHAPAVRILREQLRGRSQPMVIHYRLNGGPIPNEHWIQTSEGGGRNLGEACHFYDLFRSLTGAPVASISATCIDPKGTSLRRNDNFSATLRYEDGSVATLLYFALGPKQGMSKERMEVYCDGEAFVLDDYRSLLQCGEGKTLWEASAPDKGHDEEIRLFGDLVCKGGDVVIPFDEIIETSAVALTVEDLLHGRIDTPDD